MAAIDKTKALLRLDLPLETLVKNDRNPNKMKAREFDLLIDNIEKTGITDPILVRPLDFAAVKKLSAKHKGEALVEKLTEAGEKFRIVGGHHRFDGAAYLGFEAAPCTVIMDPDFDDEMEKFQIVRMNTIRGHLDPKAFFDLYSQLATGYSDEVLQEAFGFAEEAEFRRLIAETEKSIEDPSLKKKFKEAAKDIKTIDELSKLLNHLFTTFGDTLPYGYMFLDYAGKRSVWLRIEKKTLDAVDVLGTLCIERKRTVDSVIGGMLQLLAKGELKEQLEKIIAKTPAVEIPDGFAVTPTHDNLDKVHSL